MLCQLCVMLFYLLDWIAPTNCETKAYCKWCNVELQAKKSNLKVHSYSDRHKRASPVTNNHNSINQFRMEKSFKQQFNNFLKENVRQTEVRLALQQALHGNLLAGEHQIDVMKTLGTAHESATLKRRKATMIVCNTLAPICRRLIITDFMVKHCSFYLDESTDTAGQSFLGKKITFKLC